MRPRYSRYRGARWLLVRLAGTLVVLALALLSGAVIGGVGIYILNDALGPPPDGGATASRAAISADSADLKDKRAVRKPTAAATAEGGPVRRAEPVSALPPVGPDKASPSQATATGASAAEAQSAGAQPQASPVSQSAAAEQPQQNAAAHAAEKTSDNENSAAPPRVPNGDMARKAALAKRRAAVASMRPSRSETAGVQLSARPVYDYYGRDDSARQNFAPEGANGSMVTLPIPPRARRGSSQTKARIVVRQQDNFDQRDQEADRRPFPAQPHRSFFGFGQDRYGDRYNDDDRW